MVPRKTDRIARQQWHGHLSILHLSYGNFLPTEPKQEGFDFATLPKQPSIHCHFPNYQVISGILGLMSKETAARFPKNLRPWILSNCNIGIISNKALAAKRL